LFPLGRIGGAGALSHTAEAVAVAVDDGLTPTAIHQSVQGGHLMRNGF
jgi:hypothetical protein